MLSAKTNRSVKERGERRRIIEVDPDCPVLHFLLLEPELEPEPSCCHSNSSRHHRQSQHVLLRHGPGALTLHRAHTRTHTHTYMHAHTHTKFNLLFIFLYTGRLTVWQADPKFYIVVPGTNQRTSAI